MKELEFIKITKRNFSISVHVLMIEWDGPHTSISSWVEKEKLLKDAEQPQIDKAIQRALKDKTYFRKCKRCKELNPIGQMHDIRTCQCCADIIY